MKLLLGALIITSTILQNHRMLESQKVVKVCASEEAIETWARRFDEAEAGDEVRIQRY